MRKHIRKVLMVFFTVILVAFNLLGLSACFYGTLQNDNDNVLPDGVIMEGKVYVDTNKPVIQKSGNVNLRAADPHVLIAEDGNYYLYGTGWNTGDGGYLPVFTSTDKKNWSQPQNCIVKEPYVYTGNESDRNNLKLFNFWSPDVYYLNGKYYMFVSGPVAHTLPDTFLESQLYISTYVAESDSPTGPFEKFLRILPRIPEGMTREEINRIAPHSKIGRDTNAELTDPNYKHYIPLRVDFHLFTDPNDNKTYFVYTGYGNPQIEPDNGNHIVICELKNPSFDENAPEPAFYYDFVESSLIHASVPLDWPELNGIVPTCLDANNNVWRPNGYPFTGKRRGVTEAPNLIYKDGWYQLYFSCNTWDSPSYQIVTVMTKNLKDLEVSIRKTLSEDQIKICRFQKAEGDPYGIWQNYGSGGIFKDKDGKYIYAMHITYPSKQRDVMFKEIVW